MLKVPTTSPLTSLLEMHLGKFRELSYASPTQTRLQRWTIQAIEELSGRQRFLPLYEAWREAIAGQSERMMNELLRVIDVTLSIDATQWPPKLEDDVPLVIIANHPFGIGDGIAILALAEELGRPYRVLINKELLKIPEIEPYSLPIDFDETKEAMRNNMRTRQEALEALAAGITIVVFPAGGVATAPTPFGKAVELPWKTFTARMIQSSKASVLPIFFEGQNGPLFHLASRISLTLRLSLLVAEFRRFAGSTCHVRIGEVVSFDQLEHRNDRRALIDELHTRVHALSREQDDDQELGGVRRRLRRQREKVVRRVRRIRSRLGSRIDTRLD